MKYHELIEFDPINSIIQLRNADQRTEAEAHVRSYVISDRMADRVANVIIPQLQFDRPADNKGLLIVGNYGTGKSHLMSVISAVAEHVDLVHDLNHPKVQAAAAKIAGRFFVRRVEIGSSEQGLRGILFSELEKGLASWGIDYRFPSAETITNNKDTIAEAVQLLQDKHGDDKGILLVVDELLDYLRSRRDQELILDLAILRELGEIAEGVPFRFVGGLQESLFDSPRFGFVANELRRVRDRFRQVRIAREDIAYVVANRLLRKTDQQLAWITDHLRQFTPLYNQLAERIETFAQLFPIHPTYIETFEQVYVAEKREVLKTFSRAIEALLTQDVPTDQTGLISYDHYWEILRGDPSLRTLPNIAEVVERSNVLEGRVCHAFDRPNLQPAAIRIIHALSVQRLTTDNIRLPIGPTVTELRDGLCIHIEPLPIREAEFLLDQVQVTLREIERTVSGQFVSHNEQNGQYYLDVDKVIDFEAEIDERAAPLEDDDLNRAFFEAIGEVLGVRPNNVYVSGHNIWFYQLPWLDKGVNRAGYLFFGTPQQRSTAQPQRDFYLYLLPPFGTLDFEDEMRQDELFFRFGQLADDFQLTLRRYAGALALARESAEFRATYRTRADQLLRELNRWLRRHLVNQLEAVYGGQPQAVAALLPRLGSTRSANVAELISGVASYLLAPAFEDAYPEYPTFARLREPISEDARSSVALEAARVLAGRGRTNLATAVLEGLKLLDEDGNIRPKRSPYAQFLLRRLTAKPDNQVVNRGEIIETISTGIAEPIERDGRYQLEPPWVVVLLVSLIYNGDITLTVRGQTIDASNIERVLTMTMGQLTEFSYYRRPRSLPLAVWIEVFEALGIQPGMVRDENQREAGLRQLQSNVANALERTVQMQNKLRGGLSLWNMSLFTDALTAREGIGGAVELAGPRQMLLSRTEFDPHLRRFKERLESLSNIRTVGRMRNLKLTSAQAYALREDRDVLQRVEKLLQSVGDLQPLTSYLVEARGNLPDTHGWSRRADGVRTQLIRALRLFGRADADFDSNQWRRELETLRQGYIETYADLHRQMVLGPEGERRRMALLNDARIKPLRQLARVDLLQANDWQWWNEKMAALQSGADFHEGALQQRATFGNFRPIAQRNLNYNAQDELDFLDAYLDDLSDRWRTALTNGLQSDSARASINAMTATERRPIEQFLANGTVTERFARSANRALRGIKRVGISAENLLDALKQGGLPCTVDEFQDRFNQFMADTLRGHDHNTTRLTLKR